MVLEQWMYMQNPVGKLEMNLYIIFFCSRIYMVIVEVHAFAFPPSLLLQASVEYIKRG